MWEHVDVAVKDMNDIQTILVEYQFQGWRLVAPAFDTLRGVMHLFFIRRRPK